MYYYPTLLLFYNYNYHAPALVPCLVAARAVLYYHTIILLYYDTTIHSTTIYHYNYHAPALVPGGVVAYVLPQ